MYIILKYNPFLFLVFKTFKKNSKKISNEIKEIFSNKIEAHNLLSEKFGTFQKKFELFTETKDINKYLKELNIYIPSFMYNLWNNPKSVATLLSVSDINDIKETLAPFITNNLYENFFSSNGNEDQLLYIISLLLKKEINDFQSKESNSYNFLYETPASCIFKELIHKKEIQTYFNTILIHIIKEIETKNSHDIILFEPNEINEVILKEKNSKNKKEISEKDEKSFNYEIFFSPLTLKELKNKHSESNDKDIRNFLRRKIDLCKSNPNQYSNEKALEKIFTFQNSVEILTFYKKSFNEITNIINILFKDLLTYAESIPYFIKCICKIISLFIQKKYPNIGKLERNTFLSKFFFENLLFIIFENPSINALINQNLITEKSLNRLKITKDVLKGMISNELFLETDKLVGFNNYIIEKVSDLITFFDKLTNVSLPYFIEDLINDKLPEDYVYDYFKENKDENIFYRAICYNIDILYSLVRNGEKCKDTLFFTKKDQLPLNILISKKDLIEKLRNKNIKEEDNQDHESLQNFLLLDIIISKKYDSLINKKNGKNYFNIKELKIIETDLDKKENNIIKAKNLLCDLLYNYPSLNKKEFINENLKDIINILKGIKNHSNINSYNYSEQNTENSNILKKLIQYLPILENRESIIDKDLDNNLNIISNALREVKKILNNKNVSISGQKSIPIQWFLNSLIQSLRLLPKEYTSNDYDLLLKELEEDINKSIKELDFDFLSFGFEHLNEIKRKKYYYQKVKDILIDIDLNTKAKSIIENELIPINLSFQDNKLEIKTISSNDSFYSNFSLLISKKLYLYRQSSKEEGMTIKSFVEDFPKINLLKSDKNIFDLIKEIEIPNQIENYFKILKKYISEKNLVNENNLNDIYNKIYDYIMERLYDKLFPKEPNIRDTSIKNNCKNIIWVEPSNIIKSNKNYVMESFLPDAIDYFKNICEEKSPRKKILNLKEVFNCIFNIGKLNGVKIEGVDDEMPFLNYIFIKAKPENIYNNCKYIELFLGEKKNQIEGQKLTELLGICEKLEKFKFEDLNNITTSEYEENCELVEKG